jgi:hypothetical protein
MDVLCADKTGTLTRNALTVTSVRPMPGFRRPARPGARGAGERGRRTGSCGCGRLRRLLERRNLRRAEINQVRALRSDDDIVIASTLAVGGIAMTPIPASVVTGVLAAAVAFAFVLDVLKVPVFARLRIA